jgi:hypothetical protein
MAEHDEYVSEPRFGFTWGEVDGLVWLRNDEGDYKRVSPRVVEGLKRLERGGPEPETLGEPFGDIVETLRDEGYLEEGGDVVEVSTPEAIRLAPRIAIFGVSFAVLACIAILRWDVAWPPPRDPMINLWVLPFFAVSALLHECGHYLAARPHFEPEIRFGLLNNVFPALITETTGAWRCPRSIRIWISLAGPLVDVLLTLVLAAVHLLWLPDMRLLASLVLVQFFRILFVFNPLLEGDGYWILSDAFDIVNLRTRGWEDLKRGQPTSFALYMVLSGCFLVFALSASGYGMARLFGLV